MGFKTTVGVLALVCGGCGGPDREANAPACPAGQIFDGRYCQMATTTPAPSGGATGTGGGSATQPPPTPPPSLLATTSCASPVAAMDVAAAQPVAAALAPLAAQKAMPGAKPVGTVLAAQFQQGQCLETIVNMSPGKCYSVVATGLPTVQNLDLALVPSVAIPGLPQAIAASDNSVGPSAIIGEAPSCFKWALPMAGTMKLILSVPAGQGLAAAQVFEK